ncbi:MAG: hypothetical protein E7384_04025 [Ruminococcaceae bacterium]|nr:hypothetical protein [Oscillospiraceae bacterium]
MKACLARIKERPILIVFILFSTLFFCAAEQFNPIIREYGSMSKLLEGDGYVDLLSDFAHWLATHVSSPLVVLITVVVAIVFLFAVSAVIGIFFSGYSHVLYLSLIDHAPKKGEFKVGINKNFLKVTLYFTCTFIFSILFVVLAAYSLIPAAMTIKQLLAAGDTSVIVRLVFLCILTAVVLFFATVFFAMYLSFVLPGLIGFKRGGVGVSIKMVNGYCWYLIPRTLAYLLVMAGIIVLMLLLGYGEATGISAVIFLALNTILKFFANFIYIYYVFSTFIAMKEDMFAAE